MNDAIKAAAKWWADQLRAGVPAHDNGVAMQSALARLAADTVQPPTSMQIEIFEYALEKGLRSMRGFDADHWRPEDPIWGGAGRCFGTDYGPDKVLSDALIAASIKGGDLLLPIKTLMWVDPNSVRVSKGYGARAVSIFPDRSDTSAGRGDNNHTKDGQASK